jgi:hypothetical protein|tara:strand:- start:1869 stop:2090 length:222 start_codon:yes stop_codon:yes gene_type:complete
MKFLLLLVIIALTGCSTYYAPSGKAFPKNWGKPPEIQTKDYVPLPSGFGSGSSTLLHWIRSKQRCGTPSPTKK